MPTCHQGARRSFLAAGDRTSYSGWTSVASKCQPSETRAIAFITSSRSSRGEVVLANRIIRLI